MKLILDEINMMFDSLVENEVENYIGLLTEKLSSSSGDIIGLAAGRMGYSLLIFLRIFCIKSSFFFERGAGPRLRIFFI